MNNPAQAELVNKLIAIFPEFEAEWASWCKSEELRSSSLHAVYIAFFPLLSGPTVSDKQLKQFAELANAAVSAGGNAENAISTCVLEHLGRSKVVKSLRQYLSKDARHRLSP